MRRPNLRPAQGVSLIEALVALAVMAFGILGVVGMQMTLRATADGSKQRAEAVRIAQAALEQARAYSVLDTPDPPDGRRAYADAQDRGPIEVTGIATNTTFTLSVDTTDHFVAPDAPRSRTIAVNVTWPDRTGATQAVDLRTVLAGVAPEVAGSLGAPRERTAGERGRGGRHPAIPRLAIDQGDGTSRFSPPGGGDGLVWVFDNITAVIKSVCEPPGDVCVDTNALLLAGYVRFAVQSSWSPPTGADAEIPPSMRPFAVEVQVQRTAPSELSIDCFESQRTSHVAYYCAIPVSPTAPSLWSGRAVLSFGDFTIADPALAGSETSSSAYRVCRYTPVRNCQPTVGSTIWGDPNETAACTGSSPTPSRLMTNLDHPLDYADVATSLVNKNFLVIRAGNGSTAFECPGDDTSTPFVNGNTWRHQPSP